MMIQNEECYVAFVDILGFKTYVKTHTPEQILKMFQSLVKMETQIGKDKVRFFRDSEKKARYNELSDKTYMYIMSDSIIMAIPSDIPDGFNFIAKWCKNIQVTLLNRFNLTSRGGISKGLYYGDGTINFGRGMVSAVELEGSAEFPRIIIDPKLTKEKNELENLFGFNVRAAIDEKDGQYYIDYLADFVWDAQTRQQIQSLIQKGKNSSDDKVREKYKWLEGRVQEKIDEYEEEIIQSECNREYYEAISDAVEFSAMDGE